MSVVAVPGDLRRWLGSGCRWGEASAFQLLTTLSIAGNALTGSLPPTWCNDMTSLPAIQVCGDVRLRSMMQCTRT